MFRKPREEFEESTLASVAPVRPSVGRPPTPPSPSGRSTKRATTMASTATISPAPMPLIGRNKTAVRKPPTPATRGKGMANGNIMSFFKKSGSGAMASNEEDEGLFFESGSLPDGEAEPAQIPTPPQDSPSKEKTYPEPIDQVTPTPTHRFNEDAGPVKRRRTDGGAEPESQSRGPFLDDSDEEQPEPKAPSKEELLNDPIESFEDVEIEAQGTEESQKETDSPNTTLPTLKHESTSMGNIDEFDGIEDFIDDEFAEEGEEFLERRYMQEQAEMEQTIEDDDPTEGDAQLEDCSTVLPSNTKVSSCPICGGETTSLDEQQISLHVNECLDGKAKPLPQPKAAEFDRKKEPLSKPAKEVGPPAKRFMKSAIARPGQENPFSLTDTQVTGSSAFSKLMSGHAEDTAWATAAAAEASSRGKPAYQRTCPFYKIMPGLFICVDAFRYGAVQGCNAYFLSHFHSDHYIGLTSSWCHGPIYCSRVTGNLVRRQLRVDPKWVVDLRFEQKVEVPNTQGVDVTMIPANHCPGSSLFLFEKAVGRGKNPKVQRVLHCGDFRACPAHVQHPKLRPEFLDHVTGKLAQQKIDVCYLDTTYLTPKYAFPSQEEVIRACGQMCVSLSKDFVDERDDWESVKRERAGEGMVKFVRKVSIKDEADGEDPQIKVEGESSPTTTTKKARGRLLVIVGTYSIGKERICLGVARALNSKIYAPPNKQKIVAALKDPELSALMTSDPLEAQVHMQMLMEIRAETLADYLTSFKPHFSRIVGFRPSGWNYRPPNSRFTESPAVQTVLFSENWKSRFSMHELSPQRGSTSQAMCFGVPYSEHSSFRELTMFCCALRIDRIIPTVNVGSAKSRERMKGWCEKWATEKKKNGLFKVEDGQTAW